MNYVKGQVVWALTIYLSDRNDHMKSKVNVKQVQVFSYIPLSEEYLTNHGSYYAWQLWDNPLEMINFAANIANSLLTSIIGVQNQIVDSINKLTGLK